MLQWNGQVGVGDLILLLGFIVTVLSLLYVVRQLRVNGEELQFNNTVARAQFLLDVTKGYLGDEQLVEFLHRLDSPKGQAAFVFDPSTFPGSKEEAQLDKLLHTYDLIGEFVQLDMLGLDEVRLFALQASRVLRNQEVLKYLAWSEPAYRRAGMEPHEDALWLAEELLGEEIDYRRYRRLFSGKRAGRGEVEARMGGVANTQDATNVEDTANVQDTAGVGDTDDVQEGSETGDKADVPVGEIDEVAKE